jgi:hypothetical protein
MSFTDFCDYSIIIYNYIDGTHKETLTISLFKKDNPEKVNDFMPISLMKSLQNWYQNFWVTESCCSRHCAWIIQGCLGCAFEFLHQSHHSIRKIFILKLDFEKAFDLIEHSVVLKMLRGKGFPPKWVKWVDELLGSATTSVLLNGMLAKSSSVKGLFSKVTLYPLSFSLLLLISCSVSLIMNINK